ncbi:MAG: malonyl-CoA decarboxylase N-terminal domain-containing protein, partial [Burkholderiaceae bacterium]
MSARGEANSAAHAAIALEQYQHLPEGEQLRFFEHLDEEFGLNPESVLAAAQRYAVEPTAKTFMNLTAVAEPPRQELLRRLNRAPGGTALIVQMRKQLLRVLPQHPKLAAVEADFLHLLSSWFNPGFLEMQQVDWNSPAQLLEKIIQHEAVHAIDGWDDLRRRLQPDRR